MTNYPKIVLLCGPDMTGKSEIATALSLRLQVPYYKASNERAAFVSDQSRFIYDIKWSCPARLDLLKQSIEQFHLKGIVYDRGWADQWVYSRFFDRERDDNAVWWLDAQYAEMGALIVMTYRSSYKGIRDDLNSDIDETKLAQLEGLYRSFGEKTACSFLALNVDDENLDREVNDITTFMKGSL